MDAQVVVDNRVVHVVSVGEVGPQGLQGVTGTSVQSLILEAGEDLAVGDPVWVSGNKFYVADNLTFFRVVGVVSVGALTGFLATAITAGQVVLSGLVANTPYFLGAGVVTSTPPSSGYVIRMGQAVNSTVLIVNIEDGVLLT